LRVITIVSAIVLARLLDPNDFGMVALAGIVLSTAVMVTGLGMGPAVIQSRERVEKVAFHAICITALSGLATFALVGIFAAPFADLLGNRELTPIIRWMSLLLFSTAITAVPEALLQKELLFGRLSAIVVSTELLYTILAIGLALLGFGLWSLVYAALIKALTSTILMWSLSPQRLWLRRTSWDWSVARGLLRYGLQTTGGGLTTFFYQMVDSFTVGKLLGATALGYYGKSMDFTSRTVDGLNTVITNVLFPSYSKIQTEGERLSRAYLKSLRIVSFVTVPLSLGIFATAPEMVAVLLGEKWLPMIPALQILSFVSLVKPLSASSSALFAAVGRPSYNMRAGLVVIAVMLPLIALLLPMGFPGVALAVLGAHVAGFGFNVYQIHRAIPGTAQGMIPAIAPALVSGGAMTGILLLVKIPLKAAGNNDLTIPLLALLVLAGASVYLAVLVLLQRPLVLELLGMLRERLPRARGDVFGNPREGKGH
jgi:PST family polysaccharide transporter